MVRYHNIYIYIGHIQMLNNYITVNIISCLQIEKNDSSSRSDPTTTIWFDDLDTLSLIIMEVENYPIWKETTTGDTPVFHFHDCGRKSTLLGTNISYPFWHFWVDEFPFPQVGYGYMLVPWSGYIWILPKDTRDTHTHTPLGQPRYIDWCGIRTWQGSMRSGPFHLGPKNWGDSGAVLF